MAELKSIDKEYVKTIHGAGRIVYVESPDDKQILEYIWFKDLADKVVFESSCPQNATSSAQPRGGGGARAVRRKVADMQVQSPSTPVFGIVDRDTLLDNTLTSQDLFFETDNTLFRKCSPFNDNIHILLKWELENYLLSPEVLKKWVSSKILNYSEPSIDDAELESLLDELILLTSATLIGMDRQKKCSEKFCQNKYSDIDGIKQDIIKFFTSDDAELDSYCEKIRKFITGEDFHEKWENVTRIIDGKKALNRLSCLVTQRINGTIHWESERGQLAALVRETSLPIELVDFIREVVETN